MPRQLLPQRQPPPDVDFEHCCAVVVDVTERVASDDDVGDAAGLLDLRMLATNVPVRFCNKNFFLYVRMEVRRALFCQSKCFL